ncbi:olfactory receptor 14C36-like [Anolis carolinensis]|uniref:olfactory receptor 14C36-like n=1 Tax=Anolis carolinensis TaxID=28377 RepID=UPI000203A2A3|nr:PREDICTED: olfactory receptor 14C36-like [Anolis carolinensis]|eukprot:XP_003224611.1 PREDICTED: olfactory receptor 14C36-like [Anolis carolinensis]
MPLKDQPIINESSVLKFLLLEFSDVREHQILHFIVFLIFYLLAAAGNLLIIAAVAYDHHLHTPMYFFLINLAIQDVGQVSVIIPKSMTNSLMNIKSISYSGCVSQVLFYIFFVTSDFFLLTVMAYDRYVAICNPLRYEMVMNRHACFRMVIAVWICSVCYAILHTSGTFGLQFCSNVVKQFFCEIPQLLKLTCSDLYSFEIGVIYSAIIIVSGCTVFIFVSYVYIFTVVLRIPSAQGRQRVFSTCLPHIVVFSIFAITGIFSYLRATFDSQSSFDLALTMIYSMVPPLMNPMIYAIRNKNIRNALFKLLFLRYCSVQMSE